MARRTQDEPDQYADDPADPGEAGQDGQAAVLDPVLTPDGFAPESALQAAAEELFAIAGDLRDEKYNVLGRIDANRQTLRNFEAQGTLAESQSERLSRLYPVKRRREAVEEEV